VRLLQQAVPGSAVRQRFAFAAGFAVADDLGAAVLVSLLVARDVAGDLGFERLGEHPPDSLAGDLVEVGGEALVLLGAQFGTLGMGRVLLP
jgi:hypothetical protein